MKVSDRFSRDKTGRLYEYEERILKEIKRCIKKKLDEQGRMKYTQKYMQHSDISVYKHCISVALYKRRTGGSLGVECQPQRLIRGALLHDYFLYDWHERMPGHRFHGFIHAGRALTECQERF